MMETVQDRYERRHEWRRSARRFRKVPRPIMQHDETDCGAACLAMIARHYGKNVTVSKVRRLAGTDRMGTSGLGIVKGAEALGLSCKGMVSGDRSLPAEMPYPIVAHLKQELIDHYAVVYSSGKRVLLGDPAEGTRRMKVEQFRSQWTGVFFIFAPTGTFERGDDAQGLFSRFLFLLRPHKRLLVDIVAASVILSLLGIASAFYFRFLIDEVLYAGLERSLAVCSLAYLVVAVFQALISFARSQLMMHLANKIDAVLILGYFGHILRLPMDFFTARKTGEILSRLNDTAIVRQAISSTTLSVLMDSLMLVIGGLFLFAFGSSLVAVAMIPVALSAALVWSFAGPYKRRLKAKAAIEAEKQSTLVESINGIATIKALSSEGLAYGRAENRIVDCINRGMRLGTMAATQGALQSFLSQCGTLAVYWTGSLMILGGHLSLGQLISFVTLSGYFLGPFGRLLTLQPALQEAFVASDRLSEILDIPTEGEAECGSIESDSLRGKIEVRGLSFSYGTRGRTLSDIDMTILPGQRVAFVGASGSGKSTMTKLLMKFYRPDEGDILIDGVSLGDLRTDAYRRLVGYVPQDILLFSGTIGENIAWGCENARPADVYRAAVAAQAHDFISRLPERYGTRVGERGATLSGGERQRIALARVLLRKPGLVILDEATASLDSLSERAIMDTLSAATKSVTTILVAHRLSTVVDCDAVFVFDGGKIVERGTHRELYSLGGVYRSLWDARREEGAERDASVELV